MTDLINTIFKKCCISDDWRKIIMEPVYKGKGDPLVYGSYRAIFSCGPNDSRLHVVEPSEEDYSSGKLESTHPSRTNVKSINFFMESNQSCAAALTHFSTESLTTGPDFDPLLLLIALPVICTQTQDRQGTSYLCTRCSHWLHSRCSGLRNVADYRRASGWICTTCGTPSQPRPHSP